MLNKRVGTIHSTSQMTDSRLEYGVSLARTHARKCTHAHEHTPPPPPPPPDLHHIKPPIFICVISQFQSNNQSDPGAAALAGLGGGGRGRGERGRQGGRTVHSPVCLRWQRPRVKTPDKHQGDAAKSLKKEGWGGRRGRKTSQRKRQREEERGGGGDADQLITAANKMQIYPGTRTKFKHGTVQKRRSCAGPRPSALHTDIP